MAKRKTQLNKVQDVAAGGTVNNRDAGMYWQVPGPLQYFDFNTKVVVDYTDASVVRMCARLLAWSQEPTAYRMSEFASKEGISYRKLRSLAANYPMLKEYYDLAMQNISNINDKKAADKERDGAHIRRKLFMFDAEWQEIGEAEKQIELEKIKAANLPIAEEFKYRKIDVDNDKNNRS